MGRSRRLLQGHCGVAMRSLTNTMNLFGTDIYMAHDPRGIGNMRWLLSSSVPVLFRIYCYGLAQ
jgi:hypothetical protein